jgi:prepilin-type N-terminal cleavage/methylation domain-containing protein
VSSVSTRTSRSAGFSLAEVLVALAIAAMLAAVMTRFVSNTRLSAFKVREEIASDILGYDLIDSLPSPTSLRPGRTDGRSGNLGWRIDVTPVAFSARARTVAEKKKAQAQSGQGAAPGLTAASSSIQAISPAGQGGALGLTAASNGAQAIPPSAAVDVWVPYRVTTFVRSPSGRINAFDTIRIGRAQPDE